METIQVIEARRSIRKFKPDAVTHKLLEEIIQAASYAPSWKNTQIARYTAVESEEVKNKIASEYVPEFNKKAILSAPVLMAVSIVKKRSGYERDGSFSTQKGSGWEMYDCGIASQTLCLAAKDFGLGTVIMGIYDEKMVSELLKLPEDQELTALIAIGYPDEDPVMPKRKQVSELLRYL